MRMSGDAVRAVGENCENVKMLLYWRASFKLWPTNLAASAANDKRTRAAESRQREFTGIPTRGSGVAKPYSRT